jgi:hypothetical protein
MWTVTPYKDSARRNTGQNELDLLLETRFSLSVRKREQTRGAYYRKY